MTDKSELTAQDLKNQIFQAGNTGNSFPIFPNNRITGKFTLTNRDHTYQEIAARNIKFVDCVFKDEFIIKSYQVLQSLHFHNCEFEKGVHLEDISCSLFLEGDIIFNKDCFLKFSSPTMSLIKGIKIYGVFTLSGQFKDLTLEDINSENGHHGILNINNIELYSLKVSNCYFSEFSMGKSRTSIRNNISLNEVRAKSLSVGLSSIGGTLGLYDCDFEMIEIKKVKEGNSQLIVDKTSIDGNLDLELDRLTLGKLSESTFNELKLLGNLAKDKSLIIQDSSIQKLHFDNVVNEGSIIVRHIQNSDPGISLISSNLGKTDLINCDFSKNTFEFENSKVTEVFLSSTKFPKKIKLREKANNEQARLAFGQLNSASQKQGDSVTALEFQSREIEAHFQILLTAKNFFNLTFLNLLLNKLSNDFGRNWGRAGFFTLIVGVLFFYSLVLSTPEYSFGFSFSSFNDLTPAFFRFMNPLRFFDLDVLFKERNSTPLSFNFLSYFLDILGRIFVAYGVYQTIQAFRRFGRK